MARRLTEADVARGRRLTTIRDALRLTQDAMVERLNTSARALALPARYRYYTVSRMESGSISFEDAAIWLALDPLRRGWDWFVLGKEITPTIRADDSDRLVAGFPPKKRRVSGGHRKQA